MATKTITLELDAYERLKRAKRRPRESFSSVVRRGRWDDVGLTGSELVESLKQLGAQHPQCLLSDQELDRVDARVEARDRRPRPESA